MNSEQIDQLLRNQVSQQQQITELQVTTSTPIEMNKIAIINNFRGDKFEPSSNSSIENFIEYFEAKCRIGGESYLNIQKDLLLSCLKPETYHEIKTALIPSFENSTYDDIKNKLLDIYKTRKTRYKALTEFWSCIRDTCESMEHYANRLKELSKDCFYDDTILERQLRDRFATGLNHQQQSSITFLQSFAIAQSRELAEADINTECNINRIYNEIGNRKEENNLVMWQGRIVMPCTLRLPTLKYLHRGHLGISAMRVLARFYVWWPTIEEDIDVYVKKCHMCQENQPNNTELPIFSWSIPDNVWERIHIDFAGPS